MSDDTCLVRRLSNYIDLTERERSYIASIEEDELHLEAGAVLNEAIDSGLCVLNRGWAVNTFHAAGQIHIMRIYLPGEVLGLAELAADDMGHEVRMQTEGSICRFPKGRIGDVIAELPRLAALFVTLSGLEQITLRDRLGMIATSSAEHRLYHFLLDLRARLAVANVGSGNRFRLPLTQDEIGAAIGVTSVTVNKLLRSMRERGLIEIERPYYRLLDRERLAEEIGFVDRYASIDTSWFPAPG